MSDQRFWSHLSEIGGLQNVWWYTALALPAALVAGFALVMVTLAARQVERTPTLFFLLLLGCVPLIMILPSSYAAWRPQAAVGLVGLEWPASVSLFPNQSAETLGVYLSFLAQLGLTGAIVGLVMAMIATTATAATANVPVLSPAARQITQVVRDKTQRLRRSGTAGAASSRLSATNSPYGYVEVLTGLHTGNQFALRPGDTLGRKECDILLTDSVASRHHATFEVDEHLQTTITDQQSANGLYVYRVDESGAERRYDLADGQPFALRSDDIVTLGDPDHPEDGPLSVKLRFTRAHF
jgi:hypothetical protein